MKTFEETFGRDPTPEDFAVQKYTLQVVQYLLADELSENAKTGLKIAIDKYGKNNG